ncbi:hypothetical protein V6N12_063439, partial [Hibiscus sabdariffa]
SLNLPPLFHLNASFLTYRSSESRFMNIKAPPWAIDSWGLDPSLRHTSSIPKPLHSDYQRLLSSMPSRRCAMISLTLKCKSSDQAPVAAANSVRPVTAATVAASSGGIEMPSSAPVSRLRSVPCHNRFHSLNLKVRHPNILSFLYSTEVETFDGSGTKVTIYIVTKPVTPLSEKIKELGLEGTQVHGNVCLESVVVTQTLDWKVHAFEVLSEYDGANGTATGPLLQYEWVIGSQYKTVELAKSDWVAIRKAPPWAIDSLGLGCLIYEIFSGMKLGETEELRDTSSIPKPLLPDYQRLLSSLPSSRLNTSNLIDNSEIFQNKLVDTVHFMEILSLKDSVERDTFFRKLPTLAEQLCCQIVLNKIFPLLTSALEYGSAAAHALNVLLKTGSRLSVEEFYLKVLPTIVKLFASNDRAIRVALLQHIVQYGEPLSAQVVDDQVYPHVATGFSDTSAFLRELTLKSLLLLAPKHSQRNLSGSLLKYLSKLKCLQLEQILPYCWGTLQATSIILKQSIMRSAATSPSSEANCDVIRYTSLQSGDSNPSSGDLEYSALRPDPYRLLMRLKLKISPF